MALETVAEAEAKRRGYVTPDTSSEGDLHQRIALAHESDRERNRARQAGESWADTTPAPVSLETEARRIVHDLGMSNQAESYRFVMRYLMLETRVKKLEELTSLLR